MVLIAQIDINLLVWPTYNPENQKVPLKRTVVKDVSKLKIIVSNAHKFTSLLCKYILQPVLNTFVKETIFVEVKGF